MSHHSGSAGHSGGFGSHHGAQGFSGDSHQWHQNSGHNGFGQHQSNGFHLRISFGGNGGSGGGCEGLRHEAWGHPQLRHNSRHNYSGYQNRSNQFSPGHGYQPDGGSDYYPPNPGQNYDQQPDLTGNTWGPRRFEQPRQGLNDYHNPQGFENPYSDLEQAKQSFLTNGVDAARPLYQRAIDAADALDANRIMHDARQNHQGQDQLAQQEQMMQRSGASPQDLNRIEQERNRLHEQDETLHLLYLAPGTTRANFGFALISSGDSAEGEKMVQEALRLRPEMQDDPRFQRALNDARERGANGGANRDPYEYGGSDHGPAGPGAGVPGEGPYAPTPPGADRPVLPTPPGAGGPSDQPILPTAPGADAPGGALPRPGDPRPPSKGSGGTDRPTPPADTPPKTDDKKGSWWNWIIGATGVATLLALMKQYEKIAANENLKGTFAKDGIEFRDDRAFKAEKQAKAGEVEIDGKKVKFEQGDYIVTSPDGKNKEVVKGKDFDARFQSTGKPGEYKDALKDKVNATKLTEDTNFVDRTGQKQTAKAGDYLVTRPDGTQESISAKDFAARFTSTGKNAEFGDTVKAARVFSDTKYTGPDGNEHTAKAGDYMVTRPDKTREAYSPKDFDNRFKGTSGGGGVYSDSQAPKVTATKVTEDTPFQDAKGNAQTVKAGDYLVTNRDGSKQSMGAKNFEARFQATGQSEYADGQASNIKAKKLTADTSYIDADGRAQTAKAGEWLVLKDGKLSSVKDADFTTGFTKLERAASVPPTPESDSRNGGGKQPDSADKPVAKIKGSDLADQIIKDGQDFANDARVQVQKVERSQDMLINGKGEKVAAGDYIVTHSDKSQTIVKGADFDSLYRQGPDGRYRALDASFKDVKASRLAQDVDIVGADGKTTRATKGSWLVVEDGKLSVKSDAEMHDGYLYDSGRWNLDANGNLRQVPDGKPGTFLPFKQPEAASPAVPDKPAVPPAADSPATSDNFKPGDKVDMVDRRPTVIGTAGSDIIVQAPELVEEGTISVPNKETAAKLYPPMTINTDGGPKTFYRLGKSQKLMELGADGKTLRVRTDLSIVSGTDYPRADKDATDNYRPTPPRDSSVPKAALPVEKAEVVAKIGSDVVVQQKDVHQEGTTHVTAERLAQWFEPVQVEINGQEQTLYRWKNNKSPLLWSRDADNTMRVVTDLTIMPADQAANIPNRSDKKNNDVPDDPKNGAKDGGPKDGPNNGGDQPVPPADAADPRFQKAVSDLIAKMPPAQKAQAFSGYNPDVADLLTQTLESNRQTWPADVTAKFEKLRDQYEAEKDKPGAGVEAVNKLLRDGVASADAVDKGIRPDGANGAKTGASGADQGTPNQTSDGQVTTDARKDLPADQHPAPKLEAPGQTITMADGVKFMVSLPVDSLTVSHVEDKFKNIDAEIARAEQSGKQDYADALKKQKAEYERLTTAEERTAYCSRVVDEIKAEHDRAAGAAGEGEGGMGGALGKTGTAVAILMCACWLLDVAAPNVKAANSEPRVVPKMQ